MCPHPAAPALPLPPESREQLESWLRSRSLPNGLVTRARIVLLAGDGLGNKPIAQRLGISHSTVRKWRERFSEMGMDGLYDELRPGRPRSVSDEKIAALLHTALQTEPEHGTHWSCRALAEETGLSKSTVQRVCAAFSVKPRVAQQHQGADRKS